MTSNGHDSSQCIIKMCNALIDIDCKSLYTFGLQTSWSANPFFFFFFTINATPFGCIFITAISVLNLVIKFSMLCTFLPGTPSALRHPWHFWQERSSRPVVKGSNARLVIDVMTKFHPNGCNNKHSKYSLHPLRCICCPTKLIICLRCISFL